jgi:glycosyltransferase involved in cell wall biosynthesis
MTTIAIDYTPAIRQRAGIGRIVRGQIHALIRENPGYELRLFAAGRVSRSDQAEAPLRIHGTPISERNLVRIWHRLSLPYPRVNWFTGGPLDLLHATDFVLPPSDARHRLLTIHDLAFRFFPEMAMPSLHHYLNVVVPRSVRRASHIVADSHHTARDIMEQWRIPEERISVVQGAVDHHRFRPIGDADQQAAVRTRYGIGEGPYILALSRLEPRKNLVRLIQAFQVARNQAHLPHRLVIGGGKGWLYDEIFAAVQVLGLQDHVHFAGFVDDVHLPALYSAAEFFAYPSLYEGFGLPIVEALACGTPVLTADNSCLPEAGGPGAYYVNATDTESIAAGLVAMAEDRSLRHRLRTAGLAHAESFTWQRSAQQLLVAYRKTLES